jgi:hypothetical protein
LWLHLGFYFKLCARHSYIKSTALDSTAYDGAETGRAEPLRCAYGHIPVKLCIEDITPRILSILTIASYSRKNVPTPIRKSDQPRRRFCPDAVELRSADLLNAV